MLDYLLNMNTSYTGITEVQRELIVLIAQGLNDKEIKDLGKEIEEIAGIKTIVFSSKDEELKNLIKDMGESGKNWELYEQDNPLHHAYVVRGENPAETRAISLKIEKLDSVDGIDYGEAIVKRLFQFNTYARNIGLVLIIGLVLTAIFLISNTIKLTIMARSTEIGIMKLVGATNGFIRWPFFVEGLLLGILGSTIPITAVLSGYYYLETNIRDKITFSFVELLPFNPFAWQLSLVILVIGTFIGVWGSVMSVRKFLKV